MFFSPNMQQLSCNEVHFIFQLITMETYIHWLLIGNIPDLENIVGLRLYNFLFKKLFFSVCDSILWQFLAISLEKQNIILRSLYLQIFFSVYWDFCFYKIALSSHFQLVILIQDNTHTIILLDYCKKQKNILKKKIVCIY